MSGESKAVWSNEKTTLLGVPVLNGDFSPVQLH